MKIKFLGAAGTVTGSSYALTSGAGQSIISTSKGIMTGKDAKSNHLGGELLCLVW